VRYCSRNNK